MSADRINEGRVIAIRRLPDSRLGSPAFRITLFNAPGVVSEYRTSANVSCAYGMGDWLVGKDVRLSFTKAGRITNLVTVHA